MERQFVSNSATGLSRRLLQRKSANPSPVCTLVKWMNECQNHFTRRVTRTRAYCAIELTPAWNPLTKIASKHSSGIKGHESCSMLPDEGVSPGISTCCNHQSVAPQACIRVSISFADGLRLYFPRRSCSWNRMPRRFQLSYLRFIAYFENNFVQASLRISLLKDAGTTW